MEHRHLTAKGFSAATVDSILERGDIQDWRELFAVVRNNQEIAELVLRVANERDLGGASILAKALVERFRQQASTLSLPLRP